MEKSVSQLTIIYLSETAKKLQAIRLPTSLSRDREREFKAILEQLVAIEHALWGLEQIVPEGVWKRVRNLIQDESSSSSVSIFAANRLLRTIIQLLWTADLTDHNEIYDIAFHVESLQTVLAGLAHELDKVARQCDAIWKEQSAS